MKLDARNTLADRGGVASAHVGKWRSFPTTLYSRLMGLGELEHSLVNYVN